MSLSTQTWTNLFKNATRLYPAGPLHSSRARSPSKTLYKSLFILCLLILFLHENIISVRTRLLSDLFTDRPTACGRCLIYTWRMNEFIHSTNLHPGKKMIQKGRHWDTFWYIFRTPISKRILWRSRQKKRKHYTWRSRQKKRRRRREEEHRLFPTISTSRCVLTQREPGTSAV